MLGKSPGTLTRLEGFVRKPAFASCLLWPWVAAALPCGSVVPLSTYISSTSCTAHGVLFDAWNCDRGAETKAQVGRPAGARSSISGGPPYVHLTVGTAEDVV